MRLACSGFSMTRLCRPATSSRSGHSEGPRPNAGPRTLATTFLSSLTSMNSLARRGLILERTEDLRTISSGVKLLKRYTRS